MIIPAMVRSSRLNSDGTSISQSPGTSTQSSPLLPFIPPTPSYVILEPKSGCTMRPLDTSIDILEESELSDGICVQVNIPDGRVLPDGSRQQSRTVLRIEPLVGRSEFVVKFSTSHYAFTLKRSTTIRSIRSFYKLASILGDQHPNVRQPSLPMRPLLYMCNAIGRAETLTTWLSQILVDRQLLSNRALHLFLQTELSTERIVANANGKHDDQVERNLIVDTRNNLRQGFQDIFGNSFSHSTDIDLEVNS
jgi:hypothetical protein